MDQNEVRAWHFLEVPAPGEPPRLGNGDGRIVEVGKSLRVSPIGLKPCTRGLHACPDILHALAYGKGLQCCRVLLRGRVISWPTSSAVEKYCASERRVLAMVDITTAVERWLEWIVATTLDADWPSTPRDIWSWFHHDGEALAALKAADQTWHTTNDNDRLEAAANLVRHVAAPSRYLRFKAASVAIMLMNDALHTVKIDAARADLMQRIAPLFPDVLLEDK